MSAADEVHEGNKQLKRVYKGKKKMEDRGVDVKQHHQSKSAADLKLADWLRHLERLLHCSFPEETDSASRSSPRMSCYDWFAERGVSVLHYSGQSEVQHHYRGRLTKSQVQGRGQPPWYSSPQFVDWQTCQALGSCVFGAIRAYHDVDAVHDHLFDWHWSWDRARQLCRRERRAGKSRRTRRLEKEDADRVARTGAPKAALVFTGSGRFTVSHFLPRMNGWAFAIDNTGNRRRLEVLECTNKTMERLKELMLAEGSSRMCLGYIAHINERSKRFELLGPLKMADFERRIERSEGQSFLHCLTTAGSSSSNGAFESSDDDDDQCNREKFLREKLDTGGPLQHKIALDRRAKQRDKQRKLERHEKSKALSSAF
jgi:hypothetical protein